VWITELECHADWAGYDASLPGGFKITRLGKVAGGTCARRAGFNDSNVFSEVLPLRMDADFRWVMVNLSLLDNTACIIIA
jgi:hypothetical protein